MLQNGQSVFSLLPPELVAARKKAAQETSGGLSIPPPPAASFGISDPAQQAWLAARLTPHPFGTYESPLNPEEQVRERPADGLHLLHRAGLSRRSMRARKWAKKNGIKMVEIKTGHDAMVTVPEKLTDMLDADSV